MRTLFMSLIYSAFIICSEGVSSGDQLLQSESQMTAPGTPVKLTCNILSHTGYWIHWIRQAPGKGLEWVGRIHPDEKTINYGTTFTGQCVISRVNSQSMVYLLINSPKTEDTAVYYCARDSRGAFDYWGAGTLVTVTSAQQSKPSVFPLVSFCRNKSDANVHIGCLATGFLPQPVVVTWNAGSSAASGAKTFPAILSPNNGLYSQSSQLSVPASEWESKTYQCLVKHTPTSSEQTVTLKKADRKSTASKPAVRVLQSSCKDNSDKAVIELVCLISGFSPDNIQVHWLVNGEPSSLQPHTAPSQKDPQGIFSASSRLNISKSSWMHTDIYTCKVDHPASNSTSKDSIRNCMEFSNPMQPKVSLTGPSVKDLYISKETSIVCKVTKMETADTLSIEWQRDNEKPIAGNTKEPEYDESIGTYSSESILKITPEDWNKMAVFTCIVTHADFLFPVKKTISKPKEIGSAPTVYVFAPHQQELAQHDYISLSCLVMGFKPKNIHVQWEHNSAVVSGEDSLSTEPVRESLGTYFLYRKLTIHKSHWNSRHTFTCTAVHSALPGNNMMKREIQKP